MTEKKGYEFKLLRFISPICKSKKDLKIPFSIIIKIHELTTIYIPKGLICEHHFQAFLDKNFVIRGYQRVDFTNPKSLN